MNFDENSNLLVENIKIGDNAFNAIRILCWLIVIFGHSIDLSHIQVAYRSFIDMNVCVFVFFMLSGFWVYQSFLRCKCIKDYILDYCQCIT